MHVSIQSLQKGGLARASHACQAGIKKKKLSRTIDNRKSKSFNMVHYLPMTIIAIGLSAEEEEVPSAAFGDGRV